MLDEKTGKVITRINGWLVLGGSNCECINNLVLFVTGRRQIYSFSVAIALSCVHKLLSLVL